MQDVERVGEVSTLVSVVELVVTSQAASAAAFVDNIIEALGSRLRGEPGCGTVQYRLKNAPIPRRETRDRPCISRVAPTRATLLSSHHAK